MEIRLIIMALVCLCIANVTFAKDSGYVFDTDGLEKRFVSLTKQVRCTECTNQTIFESAAPLASDMRAQIYSMLTSGDSDENIKDYLSYRYSDFVFFKPRLGPNTWFLWLGPILMFSMGMVFFYKLLKMIRS